MFQRVQIDLATLSPVLLGLSYLKGSNCMYGKKLRSHFVAHYEIDFFIKAGGGVYADSLYHPVTEGMIHFRRPGEIFQAVLGYDCYSLCFDIIPSKEYVIKYANPVLDTIGKIIQPVQTTSYLNLFKEMMQAYTNPSPATPMLIKAQILSLLYHLYTDTVASVDAKLKNAYHGVLKKAITYMENNYQTDISVSDIAAHVDLSPNYFHKVFVSTMETTPLKYLTGLRVEHAKKLLCQSDMSIREISAECGFEHDAYFCQVFKKEAGITPAMYRKHYR